VRIYLDADIPIAHLRGAAHAVELMTRLSASDADLWMSAVQRAEIVFYMRPGEEARTLQLLSTFQTQPLTQEMVDLGAEYYRRWHPSHGVDKNDALLAATAVVTGGSVLTQNIRHFPMPEVTVERGWE
jgi:hypothetical protein